MGQVIAPIPYLITALQTSTPEYILPMSFDKFIQSRTIANRANIGPSNIANFPSYVLNSFIDFETDGFLVGLHFMVSHVSEGLAVGTCNLLNPNGAIVAKVSGDVLSIPPGGTTTNYSGAQILISHLDFPANSGTTTDANPGSRQTTIAYDADSKRIPIKSNDRIGVYLCQNANDENVTFAYTLTAYFVRS